MPQKESRFFLRPVRSHSTCRAQEPKNASVFHYNLMGLLYARTQQKSFKLLCNSNWTLKKIFFSCHKRNQDFFLRPMRSRSTCRAQEPKNASAFHYNLMGLLYARTQQKSWKSLEEFQAFVLFKLNFFSCHKMKNWSKRNQNNSNAKTYLACGRQIFEQTFLLHS